MFNVQKHLLTIINGLQFYFFFNHDKKVEDFFWCGSKERVTSYESHDKERQLAMMMTHETHTQTKYVSCRLLCAFNYLRKSTTLAFAFCIHASLPSFLTFVRYNLKATLLLCFSLLHFFFLNSETKTLIENLKY